MSDILVSIIESVAEAAATAKARRAGQAPAYLVQRFTQNEPPQPAAPPPVKPAPIDPPPPLVVQAAPPPRHVALRRLLAGPESLMRVVVGAEILGPPIALRRQNPWDTPGV